MGPSHTSPEPRKRAVTRVGKPSDVPPEEMLAFATGVSWGSLGDIPERCKCPHAPYRGRIAIKYPNHECPEHYML